MQRAEARAGDRPIDFRRAVLSACCASLVGIGLARFAYTPLLPAIIGADWLPPSAAAYLGSANLAGYLAGALLGRPLAARIPAPWLLRGMMLLATIAFLACAWPATLAWFSAWRLLSGIAGGALMVLAAPTVLPHVPPQRRGIAGGIIFAGVGLGIAASGTLVPLLLQGGLTQAWLGLCVLALVLTLLAWGGWPSGRNEPRAASSAARPHPPARPIRLQALCVSYGLNAMGLVPHMLFLVDFVARGLGQGLQSGAHYWVLFGLGAIAGPVVSGWLADRVGFGPALRLALLAQAGAVILPAFSHGTPVLIVSSIVAGAFTPGIVPLALGRIHELVPQDLGSVRAAWSKATTAFALMQAASAYGLTFVFTTSGNDYRLLFAIGTTALLLALVVDLTAARAGIGRRSRA